MTGASAEIALERILAAGLADLVGDGGSAVRPGAAIDGWRLPDRGRDALRRWGLPAARADGMIGIAGRFQTAVEPEVRTDVTAYLLGDFGVGRLCAVQGSGEVLCLPGYTEVHPQLAHLYPDGIRPWLVDSAVEHLVELAWRWHRILPLLAGEQQAANEAEVAAYRAGARGSAELNFSGPHEKLCARVDRAFHEVDPAGARFWHETVHGL